MNRLLGLRNAMRRTPRLAPLAITVFLFALTSCNGCNNQPATVNANAADLDLSVSIIDVSLAENTVPVVAQFLQNGSLVQFGSNAQVTCNGVTLAFNGLGNAAAVPRVAPGGLYTVSYNHGGSTNSVNIVAAPRPVITAPAVNSVVTRTPSLTINYVSDSGAFVRGSAGDSATGLSGNTEPDNGSDTGLNVTTLKAGPGSVGLTRELQNTLSGTGFKSAKTIYDIGSNLNVTWN